MSYSIAFVGTLFALIYLFSITKDRWNWKKIMGFLFVIIVFLGLVVLSFFGYEIYQDQKESVNSPPLARQNARPPLPLPIMPPQTKSALPDISQALPPVTIAQNPDPCEPGISSKDRIKRLAKFGSVREVGAGEYIAGDHKVVISTLDGSLVYCR